MINRIAPLCVEHSHGFPCGKTIYMRNDKRDAYWSYQSVGFTKTDNDCRQIDDTHVSSQCISNAKRFQ